MPIISSSTKRLPTSDVIANAVVDLAKKDLLKGVPVEAALMSIIQEGALPYTEVQQIGNTVFIGHFDEAREEVAMRAFNVDTARNFVENGAAYVRELAASGVKRMTSDFTEHQILQLFKAIARRPEFAEWGMKIFKLRSGGMRAYVLMKG